MPGWPPIARQYSDSTLGSSLALSYVSWLFARLHIPEYRFVGGGSRKPAYTR